MVRDIDDNDQRTAARKHDGYAAMQKLQIMFEESAQAKEPAKRSTYRHWFWVTSAILAWKAYWNMMAGLGDNNSAIVMTYFMLYMAFMLMMYWTGV